MLTVNKLHNVYQTGAEMERLVRTYCDDVNGFNNLSLKSFYTIAKNLRYIPDPKYQEFVQRPKYVLSPQAKHRDCDDKAVLMGAYLFNKRIPFRFVAVSHDKRKPLHHVLIQANIQGRNRIIDATYPRNRLFHFRKPEKFYPLTPWITQ